MFAVGSSLATVSPTVNALVASNNDPDFPPPLNLGSPVTPTQDNLVSRKEKYVAKHNEQVPMRETSLERDPGANESRYGIVQPQEQDKTPFRFVSRFSVLDEIPKEAKDPVYDSGIWGETLDTRSTDGSGHDLSTMDGENVDDTDNFPILDPSQNENMDVNEISVYAHFIKIGDIDTKNQRFSALVELIARWKPVKDNYFKEFFEVCREHPFSDPENGMNSGMRKVLPKLVINNLESASMEKTTFSMKPVTAADYLSVNYIEMYKYVKGVFHERLELESFPFDVQDLCIRLSLDNMSDNFKLFIPDTNTPAGLIDDSTTFQDDQEWVLRRLVATGENNADDSKDPGPEEETNMLIIRTNVQRKFTYFIYNCFLVMIFFAIMSYGNFANKPENVQFRLGGALTLVLTAVTYKLMLSNSLPTISYLTLIDSYVLFQIFMMTNLAVTFAALHWIWRWYADDIDLNSGFKKCTQRFQFVSPEDMCELKGLSNLLDVICVSVHATIQIMFNISFLIYAYKKVKRETDHFKKQEKDYKKFLETHPEMHDMWKKTNNTRRAKHSIRMLAMNVRYRVR